ncbi:MAG: hypothetical protein JO010_13735 [Alphaproteobacteria bacterium]|nr:hypothetical protein [Alphaproteobacteria bacterium]
MQRAAATGEIGRTGTILPARPRAIGDLPFLAQFLAQEIIAPAEPSPRWRERDSAYRIAAAGAAPAVIAIEA